MNDNFSKDLKKGKKGEKILQSYLKKRWNFTLTEVCDDIRWDFKMMTPRGEKSFEVKTDLYELNGKITGNILIEISHCGKKSGIMATEADFFIYYLPCWNKALCISSEKLRKIIKENNCFTYCSGVGDDGRASAVIATRAEVEHLFKVININLKQGKLQQIFL